MGIGLQKTPYQKQFIKDNYETMETSKIAEITGLTVKQICDYARRQGLKKQNITPEGRSKYTVDYHFFDVIDTEEKAYWLGFLYADGYIRKDGLELSLCKQDEIHLEKFKKSIKSNVSVKQKIVNGFPQARITICSKYISEKLHNLGCVRNKSLILTFPTEEIVPNNLIKHFIRGYFDGDGCVSINIEKRSYHTSFVGTQSFLTSILEILNKEIGTNVKCMRPCGNAKQIAIGGRVQLIKMFHYLYDDSTVYLDRKFEKFNLLFA